MIRGALRQVAVVTAQRLSRRGTFDAAGVAAQIRTLAEEERARRAAVGAATETPVDDALAARFGGPVAAFIRNIQLQLDVLQPKLDQCVLRAKI